MANSGNFFIHLYHKFLGLFFEFDHTVYAISRPKIAVHKLQKIKYTKKLHSNIIEIPQIKTNISKVQPPVFISYCAPSLLDKLKIHSNLNSFLEDLKIKQEKMKFMFIPRKYDLNSTLKASTKTENISLETKTNQITKKELYISRSLKTVEEILELEPYTNKYEIKNIAKLPIKKYPLKKERFSKEQLETMQTKLAVQAKCKKYSMSVENIYDKFPMDLYKEIKLEKDGTVTCLLGNSHEKTGQLQFLVTGKRKYDPQITKVFVNYSDLGL